MRLDYAAREVRVLDFIALSGEATIDLARMNAAYDGIAGRVPGNAAPIRLLDASVARADTIVK